MITGYYQTLQIITLVIYDIILQYIIAIIIILFRSLTNEEHFTDNCYFYNAFLFSSEMTATALRFLCSN